MIGKIATESVDRQPLRFDCGVVWDPHAIGERFVPGGHSSRLYSCSIFSGTKRSPIVGGFLDCVRIVVDFVKRWKGWGAI